MECKQCTDPGSSPRPVPADRDMQDLRALRSDLVRAGLAEEDGDGVVSLRCGESFFFDGDSPACFSISSASGEHSAESLLHAAVYAASSSAACVVLARDSRLHGMLLAGRAPSSDPLAPWGSSALARSLAELVCAHPADGVIALEGHGGSFLLYAPGIDHLRDLLAMLAQGYIPV